MTILPRTILMTAALVAASWSPSPAHPGHDENMLGTAQQQNGLRRGLHGAGDGLADDSLQADPPTVGRGLGTGGLNKGGVGGLRGTGLGSYGAGSVGEPGPGGLGAMKNGGLGAPSPRPR